MIKEFNPWEALYDSGRAVCESDIENDSMTCRYRNEVYTFTTMRAFGVVKYNGYFYEADIEDVRRLAAAGTA